MTSNRGRCLLLACGNTLRGDDGIGPWLAEWAMQRFEDEPRVTIISKQQWTPELAAHIAEAGAVLFVDCSVDAAPGAVEVEDVQPAGESQGAGTHQVSAPQLLSMAQELYGSLPRRAQLMTVGAGATELSEEFSAALLDAIPLACDMLEKTLREMLTAD